MTNPALSAIEQSFNAWVAVMPRPDQPPVDERHSESCEADSRTTFDSAFPAILAQLPCTKDVSLWPVGLWWPSAIRGRTRTLRIALRKAERLAGAIGLTILVAPDPPPSSRELFEGHVIRLPVAPRTARSREDVRRALSRTLGAIGYVLTDGRVHSELASTAAGVVALLGLNLLGVELRWSAVRWDASTSKRATAEEVEAMRQVIALAVRRLEEAARTTSRRTSTAADVS